MKRDLYCPLCGAKLIDERYEKSCPYCEITFNKEEEMKFTKEYSKLRNTFFTTIRKNTGYYKRGSTYTIITPNQQFKARVQSIKVINKSDINDSLALADADMSAKNLKKLLRSWYGEQCDDFVLMSLVRTKFMNTKLGYTWLTHLGRRQ